GAAHADTAGFGQRLQPRGDVDAIAEDVVVVDDDVADVDADAKRDPLLWRHAGVAIRHPALYVDRATHRIDDAGELEQQPVACRLDDAAAVFRNLRVDQFPAV